MDVTWLYHYHPETKPQSMEWRYRGSTPKFRVQKSAVNILISIFWDQDGIILIGYLPKGQTINEEYYTPLLVQLKDILKENRREDVHQVYFVLARKCPVTPDICNPEETGLPVLPMSWSPFLFSGSDLVELPPVPWTEKRIERSPFFVSSRTPG